MYWCSFFNTFRTTSPFPCKSIKKTRWTKIIWILSCRYCSWRNWKRLEFFYSIIYLAPSGTFTPDPLPPPVYADSEEETEEQQPEPETIEEEQPIVEEVRLEREGIQEDIVPEEEEPVQEAEKLEEEVEEEEEGIEHEVIEEEVEPEEEEVEEEAEEEPSLTSGTTPPVRIASPKMTPAHVLLMIYLTPQAPVSPRFIVRTNTPPSLLVKVPSPPKSDTFSIEQPFYQPAPMDVPRKPPTPKIVLCLLVDNSFSFSLQKWYTKLPELFPQGNHPE